MVSRLNPYVVVILLLTLLVPILVLPSHIENAFNTPKTSLMILGVIVMAGIYAVQFLRGRPILKAETRTSRVLLLLILLNVFSLFYTQNPYYTVHAAAVNITCILIIHFTSLYVQGRWATLVVAAAALSGVLVSMETWLQYNHIFILFPWFYPGIMLTGTIGNSNYLGAYLLFPLFAMAGLTFLLRGRLRAIPIALFLFVLAAFLFARARAGWLGFLLSFPLFLLLLKRIHKFSLTMYTSRHPLRVAVSSVIFLVLIVSFWSAAPQRFRDQMNYRSILDPTTLLFRMTKYARASFHLFKENPLFGTGLWSYRNMVFFAQAEINRLDPTYFKDYEEPKPESVHNEYLEVLNDGGLVAAAALFLFLALFFRHGWRVIHDEQADLRNRIITAAAFCSAVAILLAALFFFPFRINSTFFMTALMMGLVEGMYANQYGLISKVTGPKHGMRFFLIPLIVLALVAVFWFKAAKPLLSEVEHFKYTRALVHMDEKTAENHILKALEYDPHNTIFIFQASQFYMNILKDHVKANDFLERATIDYNGDITYYSLHYMKGLLKLRTGNLLEARTAFQQALYYNPAFAEARAELEKVQAVLRDTDRVVIKFR